MCHVYVLEQHADKAPEFVGRRAEEHHNGEADGVEAERCAEETGIQLAISRRIAVSVYG